MKNYNWNLLKSQEKKKINSLLNGLNTKFKYSFKTVERYSIRWQIDSNFFWMVMCYEIEDMNTIYLQIFKSFMN